VFQVLVVVQERCRQASAEGRGPDSIQHLVDYFIPYLRGSRGNQFADDSHRQIIAIIVVPKILGRRREQVSQPHVGTIDRLPERWVADQKQAIETINE